MRPSLFNVLVSVLDLQLAIEVYCVAIGVERSDAVLYRTWGNGTRTATHPTKACASPVRVSPSPPPTVVVDTDLPPDGVDNLTANTGSVPWWLFLLLACLVCCCCLPCVGIAIVRRNRSTPKPLWGRIALKRIRVEQLGGSPSKGRIALRRPRSSPSKSSGGKSSLRALSESTPSEIQEDIESTSSWLEEAASRLDEKVLTISSAPRASRSSRVESITNEALKLSPTRLKSQRSSHSGPTPMERVKNLQI